MTTLNVIVDQLLAPVPGGIGRYTEELTRQLIVTAPQGSVVEGVVSATSDERVSDVRERLPGISDVRRLALTRRLLSLAWQGGVGTSIIEGRVHSTSLLAPLSSSRRREGGPTVITVHDVVPWSHPETLTPRGVSWHRAMARRAERYADAIVVPTTAVATQLGELFEFGDRIHVIPGAVSDRLILPADADARARALGLPEQYILAVGTLEPRKGLVQLIRALALPDAPAAPLIVAGPHGWGGINVESAAAAAGLAPGRVRATGYVSDSDLALLYDRATAFVMPSLAEGFGLPVIEAMRFGTPVIHSGDPALVEVAGGVGITVPLADTAGYPARLAAALAGVWYDQHHNQRLHARAVDRSREFSWRDSASRVWDMHSGL